MAGAVIIPFPGPRGRAPVSDDADGLQRFVERYLRARQLTVSAANRAIVMRAITHFPGGLPARRMDIERFIDFAAGPRLRRIPDLDDRATLRIGALSGDEQEAS